MAKDARGKKLKQTTLSFAPMKNDAQKQAPQVYPIGTKFSKVFDGHGEFEGTVESFNAKIGWYHVVYEDGDEEDLDSEQLETLMAKQPNGAKRKKLSSQKSKQEKKKPKLGKKSKAPPPEESDDDETLGRISAAAQTNDCLQT